MRTFRGRIERAKAFFSRNDCLEPRVQSGSSGETSTSGRAFKTCQKAEALGHATSPSKFPWGILAAGSCASAGLGWTWGHFGNQMKIPDSIAQLEWRMLTSQLKGTSQWLPQSQDSNRIGHNFLADAAARAMPAVVNITSNNPSSIDEVGNAEQICGSGFIVNPSGIIVTNAHVVESAVKKAAQQRQRQPTKAPLQVMLQDGEIFDGEVVSLDRVSDLALVKISPGMPLPTVKLGSSSGMRVGEWVLALGSPLTLQNSVSAGIVSCVGRKAAELGIPGGATNYIQTDAAINTGNSGGPLINLAGEVVGISCMKALFSSGVSFAIPIDLACEILDQMSSEGRVVRPYIGIKMLQLNPHNTAQMHEKDKHFPALDQGILVPSVYPGSPAAKAGLEPGDIITGFGNDKMIATVPVLIEALKGNIGKPMKVHVKRGSVELSFPITALEARNGCSEVF